MLVYMFVQFVLGIVYFVLLVTVLSFSLSFIAIPFLQGLWHVPFINWNGIQYFIPAWSYPLFIFSGFLLWTIFMNIARGIGQLHGRLAKWMLVSE
jgi:hypothetical protein